MARMPPGSPLRMYCAAVVPAAPSPTTCGAQGKNCGTVPDGCGGSLDCGGCSAPDTCGGGGEANVCGGGGAGGDAGVDGDAGGGSDVGSGDAGGSDAGGASAPPPPQAA